MLQACSKPAPSLQHPQGANEPPPRALIQIRACEWPSWPPTTRCCTIDTVQDANSARSGPRCRRLSLIRPASEWLSAPAVFRRTGPLCTLETSSSNKLLMAPPATPAHTTLSTRIEPPPKSPSRRPLHARHGQQPASAASGPATACLGLLRRDYGGEAVRAGPSISITAAVSPFSALCHDSSGFRA